MNPYKDYRQEGNVYTLRLFSAAYMAFIVIGLFLLYAAFFMIDSSNGAGRNFAIFGGLFFIILSLLRMGGKFIIDKNHKKFIFKRSAIGKEIEYPIEGFSRFYVTKFSYFGFLTTNVVGEIYFWQNGKEKAFQLKQTFLSAKPVQRVIDETADILGIPND